MQQIPASLPVCLAALLCLGGPDVARAGGERSAPADRRPNIILILVDDMGFSDLGCYGSEIRTPHLDSLARRGVRYTNFYNAGRCCPTRASLMTGLYPHQAGVGYMEPSNRYNQIVTGHFDAPQYQGNLNRNCVTLAELLRASGYQTFMTGKWHLGAEDGQRPLQRGFDRYFGLVGGASDHRQPRPGQYRHQDEPLKSVPDDFYTTDYFTRYAADFVKGAERDRPFFLYLPYSAPHWPLQAWPEDVARYRGQYRAGWDAVRERRFTRQKELGLFPPHARLSPRDETSHPWDREEDPDNMDLRMAVYAAMIDRVDQGVGRLLETLRDCGPGVEENTLILFLSDNGGCAEPYGRTEGRPPNHAACLLPWANASNTPFRLFKHWVHAGGVATPLIGSWRRRVPAGVVNTRQTGHVKDILPTLAEAAGATYPAEYGGHRVTPAEGKSLLHSFLDPNSVRNETLYWEHEGNRAVRAGRWKLVSYYNDTREAMGKVGTGRRTGAWELYDLEADPTELTDLAERHPGRVRQLLRRYESWERRVGVIDWERVMKAGWLLDGTTGR